LFILTQI